MSQKRTLLVVRHCERLDNVQINWRSSSQGFTSDNSPLSDRGRSQAKDLQKHFEKLRIDSIYVSPFDRTMETATILLGDHSNEINVEPGFCEVLYLCNKPPGFWSTESLKEKFDKVSLSYEPAIPTHSLGREDGGDEACVPRIRKALDKILKRDKSSVIMIVSHGAAIGGIHEVLGAGFTYVGQGTISKFEETAPESGEFRLLSSSESSHLSAENRRNLRAW